MRGFPLAAAAVAFACASSAAKAEIIICNDFRAPIRVAFASENQGNFTASGWWVIKRDACETTDFAVEGTTLHYTADSDEYKNGSGKARDHWGNKTRLFVTEKKFTFEHAEERRRGTKAQMFGAGTVPEPTKDRPVQITLRFTSGNTSITVKSGK
jgi:uncharacterized membrane protein